jgi:hypothetical protein
MKNFLVFEGTVDEIEKQLNNCNNNYDVVSFTKMNAARKLAVIVKKSETIDYPEDCNCSKPIELPKDSVLEVKDLVVNGKKLNELFDNNNKKLLKEVNKLLESDIKELKSKVNKFEKVISKSETVTVTKTEDKKE